MTTVNFQISISVPDFIAKLGMWILLHYRKIRYGYVFRRIKLTRNKYAIVDLDDFDELSKHKWCAIKGECTFYARRVVYISGKAKNIPMHRKIMKYDGPLVVDHINGNGLDNRKDNLRIVTPEQNNYNTVKGFNRGSSRYKGVGKCKDRQKWYARIGYKGRRINLGMFDNEIDAAKAYDEAARELYREYAHLNFN